MTEPIKQRDTFQAALFFWMPDFMRGEQINVGVALVSKQTEFCKARMASFEELLPFGALMGYTEDSLRFHAENLQAWADEMEKKIEVGTERPLRWDHAHVFHALFGKGCATSSLQWRTSWSGLILTTPQETLDEMYLRMVARPPVKDE